MTKPDGIIEVFLQPGEYYFGDRSTRIRTLLGSCVSMVFWHPKALLGGMCHFLLPSRKRPILALDGRYGDEALELVLREIKATNTRPEDYRIGIFGGGDMFPQIAGKSQIGQQNVDAAKRLIKAHGLICHGAHAGGVGHRNLILDVWSGRIALKHPPHIGSDTPLPGDRRA